MKKIIISFVIINLLLYFTAPPKATAQVNTQDSLALLAVYNSTDGINWSWPWMINLPVSNWTGVTIVNNRVTILNLFNMGLNGIISPEIGNLSFLKELILENNNLYGTIPAEIGNLTELTNLNLKSNNLTGSIPIELFNLSNLTILMLWFNQFTGNLPPQIGSLINLTNLYLNDNNFSGQIPNELYNITTLQYINLSNNQFSGNISTNIYSLVNLYSFGITNNNIENLPDLSPLNANSLLAIGCNNNKLTFEDLETNISIAWQNFNYVPQDSVWYTLDTAISLGSSVSFSTLIGGSQNHYQWYHNGSSITNANDSVYTINNFTATDTGKYTCAITNSIVPYLTLWRRTINLRLDTLNNIEDKNLPCFNISISDNNIKINTNVDNCNAVLYTFDGKSLLSIKLIRNCQNRIALNNLPKGILLLKISNDKNVLTRKIVNL